MLCRLCRQSILSGSRRSFVRGVATIPSTSNAAPITPPPSSTSSRMSATSSAATGVSQPLSSQNLPSAPFTKSGSSSNVLGSTKSRVPSSVSGGTELKGLAYLKAKPHIIAKEDDQYPDWLWALLDDVKAAGGEATVDVSTLNKKQRIKYERKQAKLLEGISKPIPVHEQSRDLTSPGDSAEDSLQKRSEITKSSRQARRKDIRESNFLKSM